MQKARRKTPARARAARSTDFTRVPSVVGTLSDTRISINGGPEVSLDLAHAAVAIITSAAKRTKGQTDLEYHALGVPDPAESQETQGIAADRLRSLIERIERLEGERKAIGSDIKDIYVETKSAGFSVSTVRQLIMIRRREPAEVEEQETLLDIYRRALGM